MQLMLGDCLEMMKLIPDSSVDMVLTDPPYFKLKGEPWDNQWSKPEQFLSWMDSVLSEFVRILKPCGSLYLFASARMASRVECLISERLRVLNHIVWVKPDAGGAEKGARAGKVRSYVAQTERLLFACHQNPLGDALRSAMNAAGLTALGLNRKAFGRSTGIISLWLCDRQAHGSCEPSREDWVIAMKACGSNADGALYDSLYRTFMPGERFTDTWHFPPVKATPGKHPCEKPSPMLQHIINASTKPGDIVLDAFMGTGSTGIAAAELKRKFIGIEMDKSYFMTAKNRIEQVKP